MRKGVALPILVAGIFGGLITGVLYALLAVGVPAWFLFLDHPQYTNPVEMIPGYVMVGGIIGILFGAAAGAISGVCYAFAVTARTWIGIAALMTGPLITAVAAYVLLIQYDPTVSGRILVAFVIIVGSGGFIVVGHRAVGMRA